MLQQRHRFPIRNHLKLRMLVNLMIRGCGTGTLQEQRRSHAGKPVPREMAEIEEEVLGILENDATMNTRL